MRSRVMKTRIFIFLTILNIVLFNIEVKGTEVDTTNLIKPEILDMQCGNNPFFSLGGWAFYYFLNENGNEINIYAVAQPYSVHEKTAIKSIFVQGGKDHPTPGLDSNLCYFQIWDASLTNLIYQVRYDTLHQNYNFQTDWGIHPCEIVFDSTIVVEGDFYVVQTVDTLYNRLVYSDYSGGGFYMLTYFKMEDVCEDYDKYPQAKIKLAGSDEWIYPNDMPQSQSTQFYDDNYRSMVALPLYPKIDTAYVFTEDTTTSVGIVDITVPIVNIFPNPVKAKLNIQSSHIINDIEIYNPLGQKILSKKIAEFNTTINTSFLERGNYILKINTSNGLIVKRFLVL